MSMLDKFFNRAEPDDDETVTVKTKAKLRQVRALKVGDEITISQRVRIVDIRDADDRKIGSVARNKVLFMEVKAVGGVFNNISAIATASEKDQVEMASGQANANAAPRITSDLSDNNRDDDEMHGTYSTIR